MHMTRAVLILAFAGGMAVVSARAQALRPASGLPFHVASLHLSPQQTTSSQRVAATRIATGDSGPAFEVASIRVWNERSAVQSSVSPDMYYRPNARLIEV